MNFNLLMCILALTCFGIALLVCIFDRYNDFVAVMHLFNFLGEIFALIGAGPVLLKFFSQ